MRFLPKFFLTAICACTAQFALGDSLYSFSNVNQTFPDNSLTLGFVFTVNTTFQVTSLGWFSPSPDGFQAQHTVGIFDSAGNLLGSTVLATGTSNPLSDSFRYQSITPITLNSGAEYTLAGTSGELADSWTTNDVVSGFTVSAAFTIGPNAARYSAGSEFVDPTSHYGDYLVYAGPNLEGNESTSVVPEPTSLVLVPFAAAGLLLRRRLRSMS